MKTMRESFEEKFVKGEPDACWEWTASKFRDGYGQFYLNRKPIGAHRFSWMLYVGEVPDGLWVLHKCDNRGCVNPAHLFLGTHTDNMRDCASKGRFPKRSNRKILTEEQVKTIRVMWLNGVRNITLTKIFGVANQTISNITHHHTWK